MLSKIQDRWKEVDPDDNRRFYGNLYMKSVGRESAACSEGLLSVLSTWPLTNDLSSYTAVMTPGQLNMESFDVYT